jgi:rod shape-determining protein MreC
MKNILVLIQRFYLFLVFLGLQILALTFFFKNNNYHQAEFINHSTDWVGSIYSQRAELSQYLRLGEINDQLSLENAQLRSMAPDNFIPIRHDVDSVIDSTLHQRFFYRTAKVVNATFNREKNYITLDRGKLGEVTPDMGVISGGGIVGVVRSVSDHFAIVMPVIHADFITSVRHKRSGIEASLRWPGGDPGLANAIDISKNIPVEIGDTVVTSGFSGFFPANIYVGVVEEIDDSDNEHHLLRIRLGADFRKLDHVLVITDSLKSERENLLNSVIQQDAANDPH